MKHILLTGANGFVGKVLLEMLLAAGYKVSCTSSSSDCSPYAGVERVTLDIRDASACASVIKCLQPTHLIHLAAISHVPTSFREPLLTWHTNVLGCVNLLEAVKEHAPDTFSLFASSSEVYGEAFKVGMALDEGSSCLPMNPYAASKLAAELAFKQYFKQGLKGVIARPFNHVGVGQSPEFVTASFAKQIALIEGGRQEPVLKVGNLDACRDFLDVRDVCAAYIKLLDLSDVRNHSHTFNIASGVARRIHDVLQDMVGQSSSTIRIELDPERLRPSDIPFAVGNCGRIQHELNWRPQIHFVDTIAQLLADWRVRVAVDS